MEKSTMACSIFISSFKSPDLKLVFEKTRENTGSIISLKKKISGVKSHLNLGEGGL